MTVFSCIYIYIIYCLVLEASYSSLIADLSMTTSVWFPFAALFPLCNRIKPMSAQRPDWHSSACQNTALVVSIIITSKDFVETKFILRLPPTFLASVHANSLELCINCHFLDMLGDQSNATMLCARAAAQLQYHIPISA